MKNIELNDHQRVLLVIGSLVSLYNTASSLSFYEKNFIYSLIVILNSHLDNELTISYNGDILIVSE